MLIRLILVALHRFLPVYGKPVPHVEAQPSVIPLPSVDTSQDAWSSTLSGVGPLVLLIGEKSTKQVLRGVRGLPTALSLGAAPLGLFSLVASFLRLCGIQRIRTYMGYELEPRLKAALELTKVNCNGVYGKIVNGYIECSTDDEPSAKALMVSYYLGEDLLVGSQEALLQLEACYDFETEKSRLRIPASEAALSWCFRMTYSSIGATMAKNMIEKVVSALQIREPNATSEILHVFPQSQLEPKDRSLGKTAFTFTFPAMSEMSTRMPLADSFAGLVALFGFLSILVLQFLELRRLGWQLSAGLILVFVGYMGIICFVTTAGLRIKESCANAKLRNRSADPSASWIDGIVLTSKTNDNMDTSGTRFWSTATGASHVFEAVWLKDPTPESCYVSTAVALALIASFICHYLGLRSCSWWVSVGELGICLIAAFGRSITKTQPEKLHPVKGVMIDWRCLSTGIIDVRAAEKVDIHNRVFDSLDLRAYSEDLVHRTPNSAESIAWYVALQCIHNKVLVSGVLGLTGTKTFVYRAGQPEGKRAILAFFNDGIISSDGLVFPNTDIGIAFRSRIANLAAPTLLLARGIFRHAEWFISNTELHQVPLGAVHKPALSMLLNWWTLSENRNDMGDNQKNLQYALFYVNVAFFIGLLEAGTLDPELGEALQCAHDGASQSDRQTAETIVGYLKGRFDGGVLERTGSDSTVVGSPGSGEEGERKPFEA